MPELPLNLKEDAIRFINTATDPAHLNGLLTIGHSQKSRGWVAYELHWGSSADTKLSSGISRIRDFGSENIGTEAAPRHVFNQPLTHQFDNTPIPHAASHLLVFIATVGNQQKLYASRPLRNRQHLLPPSATQLERHLAATSGRLNQLPVLLDTLWDPSRCPARLLPWLAWATSTDIWFDNKDDPAQESSRRRQLIRKSAFVHQHKGTRAAIQKALDAFDAIIILTEWWEQTPRAHPHTFHLDLLVNGNTPGTGTAELNRQLRQAIDTVKPVRSHYIFTLSTVQSATIRMAASAEAVSYKRFNMAAVIQI